MISETVPSTDPSGFRGVNTTEKKSWLRSKWPRLLVTLALLGFVVSRVDRGELAAVVSRIDHRMLLLALLSSFAMLVLNALRWWIMLRALGARIGLHLSIYYYFLGAFFNSFMPTSIGGDLVRVVAVSPHTSRRSVALASVVVERLLGLFALVPMSLVGIGLTFREFHNPRVLVAVEGLALAVFIFVALLLNRRVAMGMLGLTRPLLRRLHQERAEERMTAVYDAICLYGEKRGVLVGGFLLSLLSRLVWIMGGVLIADALDVPSVTLPRLLTVVPLVELARVAPVSLGGIGVREASFAGLMAQYGTPETQAILIGFLFYLLLLINGVAGGAMYVVRTATSAGRKQG